MLKPAVQIHNIDGVLVAEFWDCYRLDLNPVKELRTLYENHVRSKGKPIAVVDLLGVGFAGSAALGNFVALHRVARQFGGQLIFCNVEPTVLEVFRVSKLDPLFSFTPDRAKALELAATLAAPEPRLDRGPAEDRDDDGDPASLHPPSPSTPPAPPKKSRGNGLRRTNLRRKLS
jgi:anti-anti-sigma factor